MQTAILSTDELELINSKTKPRNRKSTFYVFIVLLVCSFVSPFLRGRHRNTSAFEEGRYISGLVIALLIFMSFALYFYYRMVFCLNKDIESGKKHIIKVPILSKKMITDSSYEVMLDIGKLNIDKKVTIPAQDVYEWIKGDLVEVHFLKRSGTVLSYKNK
jgi:hypothetical protein